MALHCSGGVANFDFIENNFATPVILSLPFYFLVYSYIGNSISMSENNWF